MVISPEPVTFLSSNSGLPLYSISPDPVILPLIECVAVTSISPDPVILASTSSTLGSSYNDDDEKIAKTKTNNNNMKIRIDDDTMYEALEHIDKLDRILHHT